MKKPMAKKQNSPEVMFPPHDITAERAVLASMMLSGDAVIKALTALTGEEFYNREHTVLFKTMREITESGGSLDVVIIKNALNFSKEWDSVGYGGSTLEFVMGFMDEVAHGANILQYIDIVKKYHRRRLILAAATEIVRDCYIPSVDENKLRGTMEDTLMGLMQTETEHRVRSIGEVMKNVMAEIVLAPEERKCIRTGIADFDDRMGGLQAGSFVVIAAFPGIGKTTLALNIARYALINQSKSALIVSAEMRAEEITKSLIASYLHIDNRYKGCTVEEAKKIEIDAKRLVESRLWIYDRSGPQISVIRQLVKEYNTVHKIDMLIVDYIQLLSTPDRDTREQEVAAISRGLKHIAKDYMIPVIGISQLSREGKLRDSGQIEADADAVVMLDCAANDPDTVADIGKFEASKLIFANMTKNRLGPVGKFLLTFVKEKSFIGSYKKA